MAKNATKSFLIQFGNHAKDIRIRKNMTQAQIAKHCGFDISVISRIERGVVNTSVGNANLIAYALGIEMKELFDFIPLL